MPIEIGFLGKFYPTQVCFSDDLPLDVLGMLGHDGFFDRFHVIANNEKKRVSIKERDLLRQLRYTLCPVCGFGIDDIHNVDANYCFLCGASLIVPPGLIFISS